MKKLILATLAVLISSQAFAQWQVPNGSVPVGRGPGVVGFGVVGGSSGAGTKCLIDTTPPTFGSCVGGSVTLVVGSTTITGGTTKSLLYNNAGVLGNLATANNGVLTTDGSGTPSITTSLSLPSGTITTPAYYITGGFKLADHQTNFNNLFEPIGGAAINLGSNIDPTNYYNNTSHVFRDRSSTSVFGTLNNSGLVLTVPLAGASGGTGVSNSGKTITIGGNFSTSAALGITAGSTGQLATWASGTTLAGSNIASSLAGGTNIAISGTTTATIGLTGIIGLTNGGSNANLTASNGGIVYTDASKMAILGGTVTAGQCLLSGSSTAPTWGSCTGGTAAVSSVADSGAGTLIISPTTSSVLARINLANANIWTGKQTFGSGVPDTGILLPTTGTITNAFDGTIGSPQTSVNPSVYIYRTESVAGVLNGYTSALLVGATGINVTGGHQTQAIQGTAAKDATSTHDVVGVYGTGDHYGSNGTAFGAFFAAATHVVSSSTLNAIAVETSTGNGSGSYIPYSPTPGSTPAMQGLDVSYGGSIGGSAGADGGVAMQIRGDFDTPIRRWDVGVGFMTGGIRTADIQTNTSAVHILYAPAGSHSFGINLVGATFSASAFISTGFSVGPTGAIFGTGSPSFVSMTSFSAALNGTLCYNAANGIVSYNPSSTCTVSSERFKNKISSIDVDEIIPRFLKLDSGIFTYKNGYGLTGVHNGYYAEELCAMDENLCIRDQNEKVFSYDVNGMIAIQGAIIQRLITEVRELKYNGVQK